MTRDSAGSDGDTPEECTSHDDLPVDNDGRPLYAPKSRWSSDNRKQQTIEAVYIIVLLLLSLGALTVLGVRSTELANTNSSFWGLSRPGFSYGFLAAGGLLGGTVYGAKWLYHSVAKGLWHEDRRLWRYMQPWISLGTTIGIWALIDSGFFRTIPQDISMLGIGFVIGYLSDQFLAKMKEITNVLFGRAERHFGRSPGYDHSDP